MPLCLWEDFGIAEQSAALVFLRDDGIDAGNGPRNGEIGIVPQNCALAFR